MARIHHHEILLRTRTYRGRPRFPTAPVAPQFPEGSLAAGTDAADLVLRQLACGVGVIVIVRPSLLKLANSGT